MPQGFSSPAAARLARISYRQLDYWDSQGLVRPSLRPANGHGSKREYSFEDLKLLVLVAQLRERGVSLKAIAKAMKYLREQIRRSPQSSTLVTDGKDILLVESPESATSLGREGQLVWTATLDLTWRDLADRSEQERATG
jgi:DNA-binding transcriptional MerR regulator